MTKHHELGPFARPRALLSWLIAGCSILLSASCGDDHPPPAYAYSGCRFDTPSCYGSPGGACRENADCTSGSCCTEKANCGGGMCAVSCRGDADCPYGMACEHEMCFFACRSDTDCAVGQKCEHGHRVCEWP
jgi:hypothetical protein